MVQTYLQLQRQFEKLQRQTEKLKAQEVSGVVGRIMVAIAHYGLTAEQLGFGSGRETSQTQTKPNSKATPTDPRNNTATTAETTGAALARAHVRLKDALAAGASIERFAVDSITQESPGT